MPKNYKIKRYRRVYRSGPHPLTILLSILGIAALIFVGISIYSPVYNFIMGQKNNERPLPSQPDPLPVSSEAQQEEEPPEPEPAPAAVVPELLRTVYMPPETALNEAARDAFLDGLGEDVKTVLIDIKDKQGVVLFGSWNEQAAQWKTVQENPLNLNAFASALRDRGLQLAVRLPAFNDRAAPFGDRSNAIHYQNGDMLWLDAALNAGGKPWLNPYADGAQQYIVDLAVEAVEAGAVMVVLEDVQFAPGSSSASATFGETGGKSRQEVLREFVGRITAEVEAAGGRLGVYLPVTALTDNGVTRERYGGSGAEILDGTLVLGLLPYQFTNGYVQDGLSIPSPLADPAQTVQTALAYVYELLEGKEIEIIPLIQGGSEAQNPVTPAQMAEQLDRLAGLEVKDFILYQTQGQYVAAAR